MKLRLWLHEGQNNEPGFEAWALDLLGFATWAPDEAGVLARVPDRFARHAAWLRGYGEQPPAAFSAIEVVDRIRGNEVFFEPDREPATLEEIDQAIRLLRCSRSDLLAELEGAHDELLDWDPPYRRFASWASWRTIRATLAHIANCETHYYLRGIGYRSPSAPASPQDHRRVALSRSRDEAFEFLTQLKSANDLARVSAAGGEHWSVRKALRRMVWHELLHLKSIRRITDEYQRRERVMRRDVR